MDLFLIANGCATAITVVYFLIIHLFPHSTLPNVHVLLIEAFIASFVCFIYFSLSDDGRLFPCLYLIIKNKRPIILFMKWKVTTLLG